MKFTRRVRRKGVTGFASRRLSHDILIIKLIFKVIEADSGRGGKTKIFLFLVLSYKLCWRMGSSNYPDEKVQTFFFCNSGHAMKKNEEKNTSRWFVKARNESEHEKF